MNSGPIRKVVDEVLRLRSSRRVTSEFSVPSPPGLEYRPYQLGAIEYAWGCMEREQPGVLFADDMGLGKTLESIGLINLWDERRPNDLQRVLIVCPKSVKFVWLDELRKWLVHSREIAVIQGRNGWEEAEIAIMNYALVKYYKEQLDEAGFDLIICDESHNLKNQKAGVTRLLLGNGKNVKEEPVPTRFLVMATGTPMPNARPAELWSTVRVMCRDFRNPRFTDWWKFANRYCNGGVGWGGKRDFTGASNLPELQQFIRTHFMIRRMKRDVLKELPEKTRQIIRLPASDKVKRRLDRAQRQFVLADETLESVRTAREAAAILDDEEGFREAIRSLAQKQQVAFDELAAFRLECGEMIVPMAVEHIHGMLKEDRERKALVFGWHRSVMGRLQADLSEYQPVVVHGGVSEGARRESVRAFQEDPGVRVFLGNKAAYEGITLTASDLVIFVEQDWVPANITQAEDRAHRFGQKKPVLVQHLTMEGSIAVRILEDLITKQEIADKTLDDKCTPDQAAQREKQARKQIWEGLSEEISWDQAQVIHRCLKELVAIDSDKASKADGKGLNRVYSAAGHALAERETLKGAQAAFARKIVLTHRRQLKPEDIRLICED